MIENSGEVLENSQRFKLRVDSALSDQNLHNAMKRGRAGFVDKRAAAINKQPEFELWRDKAADVCDQTLLCLDAYLEQFETAAVSNGANIHWAENANDARKIVRKLCDDYQVKRLIKSKSMVTEEVALNSSLEQYGKEVIETDLGEYIIQLRNEKPSHIIAPAAHLARTDVEKTFRKTHKELDPKRLLDQPEKLVKEARKVLRKKFASAQMGITGANFLIAETGEVLTITNEGNADHVQFATPHLVVLAGIDKIIPTRREAALLLRLLTRSATGQESTVYTTWIRSPHLGADKKSDNDTFDIVLIDNGRSEMLGSEFRDMLRCIRCGACMNHCPVYQSIGGHAYGSVYPGPMGSVLTPWIEGHAANASLPNASTLCGACGVVCPVKIPLPDLLRNWRIREFNKKITPSRQRFWLKLWGFLAQHPKLYRFSEWCFVWGTRSWGWIWRGRISFMPFASAWTRFRDFPVPQSRSFLPWIRNK